jgi:hypothetical protein
MSATKIPGEKKVGRRSSVRRSSRSSRPKEQRQIDENLVHAYSGQADAMLEEVEDLLDRQRWPSE